VLDPIPVVQVSRTEFAVPDHLYITLESRCNFRPSPDAAAWQPWPLR
jgi:hypothetical protein